MELRIGLPITEFKKGQIITRLEKAEFQHDVYNDNLGIVQTVTRFKDGSYRGDPLEFMGIENNMIIVKSLDGLMKGHIIELAPENGWSEGWGIYVDYKNKEK